MLLTQEKECYAIAYAAATGQQLSKDTIVCTVCGGCGLLRHPSNYLGVADCYMCGGTGVLRKNKPVDSCGCVNASSPSISA